MYIREDYAKYLCSVTENTKKIYEHDVVCTGNFFGYGKSFFISFVSKNTFIDLNSHIILHYMSISLLIL